MTYILSVDAELDLDEIWEYIARDSPDAADRWIAKLFDEFDSLAQRPGMGHKREDLTAAPTSSGQCRRTSSSIASAQNTSTSSQ